MTSKLLVAVDIGSTHLAAMAAEELGDGTLRILGVEEREVNIVRQGIVENCSQVSYKINEIVRLLQNRINEEIHALHVTFGGRSMKMIEVTMNHNLGVSKSISSHTIEAMTNECRVQVEQQNENVCVLDVLPKSYVLDHDKTVTDVARMKASHVRATYNVVVGLETVKSGVERCFDRTGILIKHHALKMEAQSTAVLTDEDRERGVAIIDLGGETTMLSVYKDGELYDVRVMPLGGRNITRDIQYLEVSEPHAERLKKVKGCALTSLVTTPVYVQIPNVDAEQPPVRISTEFLAEIIESRMLEMLAPLFRMIRELPFELEGGVVLTGGGAMMNGVCELVEEQLSMPVVIGSHSEWLSDGSDVKYESPVYSQLVGLLALAAQYCKEHVEADKPEEPKVPGRRSGGFMKKFGDAMADLFSDGMN